MTLLILLAIAALGFLAAGALAPAPEPAPAGDGGVRIVLPPIPLQGATEGEANAIVAQLAPTVRPRLSPPGWTLEWPPIEVPVPAGLGSARFQLPPQELPLLPPGEVQRIVGMLRPQLVRLPDGFAVQFAVITA